MAILNLFWQVLTLASFFPALMIIARNRRHFEYYVACFQMVAGAMYSASHALSMTLFIQQHEWHFLSDWLICAYACLLCIHLLDAQSEDVKIVLRYAAFTATMLAKYRDGWESGWNQGCVIIAFALTTIGTYCIYGAPSALNKRNLAKGAILCGVALILLAAEVSGRWDQNASDAMLGIAHMVAGQAALALWSTVPCRDSSKKTDRMPSFV